MSAPVIVCQELQKRYDGLLAVNDVSFEVARGEIFGLLGPNGAGKTTTVECLQGLRRADGGRVRVLGLDPQRQARQLRRRIGSQLQQSALPDHIRSWEALDLFAALTPGATNWRELLEQWGLTSKRRAAFHSLSGGQRQRLFVALALVNEPELVFLDEMTTGLDPAARRATWDLISEIRERGVTVILVTHFMEEAERLCDRVAIMDAGRIVALDRPCNLIQKHAGGVHLTFTTKLDNVAWLNQLAEVDEVKQQGRYVHVRGRGAVLARVAHALVEHGAAPADLTLERPTLEDVFLHLTGHEMRE